jgi:Spy/CpxP family protein refolding chaperone
MKINKISMAIMAATAVLAVSPAVRAQTTDTNSPAGEAPARPRGGPMLTVDVIDKAVTLTDAEKPKVKTAVEDFNKAAQEARSADQSERRAKMTAARDDLDKKMKEILTPEQYTKFQAMPRRGGGRNGAGGAGGAPATPPPAN